MTTINVSANSPVNASGRSSSLQSASLGNSKSGPLRERMWSSCQIGWSHLAEQLSVSCVRQNGHAHISCQVVRKGKAEQLPELIEATHEIVDGILHIVSEDGQGARVVVCVDVRSEEPVLMYASTDLFERAGMSRIGVDRPVLVGLRVGD